MDLWGPASVQSLGGNRYTIDFVDDATCWTELYLLCNKSEALNTYKRFEAALETQNDMKVKYLCLDHGAEFTSKKLIRPSSCQGN